MRRTTAILALCLGTAAGCRGGAAQPHAAPAPGAAAAQAEMIASEPEAPWAIALLSDAREAPRRRPGKVVVVDVAAEKAEAPKSCSGVVNRRS